MVFKAAFWLCSKESSTTYPTNISGILSSFEYRLSHLERTILPVYQETEALQRRQDNIDRTLKSLDHVIGFYNVSKEVEEVVKTGPSGGQPHQPVVSTAVDNGGGSQCLPGLEKFLHSMSRY